MYQHNPSVCYILINETIQWIVETNTTDVQELVNMQRAELVQLETFLETQAIAGKCLPLKDATFRKRSVLPLF